MAVYSHDIPTKYYSRDDLLFLLTSVLVGVLTFTLFLSILGLPQLAHQQAGDRTPLSAERQERSYPALHLSGSPMGDYVSPHTPLYWRG